MRKSRKLLTAITAAAAMSILVAGTALADYELYDVEWGDGDYSAEATWDDDDCDYDSYQVKLIRNGNDDDPVRETTTSAKHHNFAGDITREGTYTFRVRVRYDDGDEGEWYESDEIDVDEDFLHHLHGGRYDDDNGGGGVVGPGSVSPGPVESAGPGAMGSGTGWIENGSTWYYRNSDGSLAADGWDNINGHWYYFNNSGMMETGWIQSSDGHWYYCVQANNPYGLPEGAMLESNYTPDGYYVNAEGIWQ